VYSNDLNTYAATLATCYVQADRGKHLEKVTQIIAELNTLPKAPGYFTETFCEKSRFFHPKNGAKVDAIREWIAARSFSKEEEAILLVSLMEAADRVDSTTGVQMAYLKSWAPRAHNDLKLRVPDILDQPEAGPSQASQLEALVAATTLSADVAYLDPPYNQHKYVGNYHIWETLVRWDKPETYGIACKRTDCRERLSDFNSRRRIHSAMADVVNALDARHIVVSFNNEGFIKHEDMIEILSKRGDVFVVERSHPRYVGARIGIYNPSGDKVGKVSHVQNKEFLFIVPEKPDDMKPLEAILLEATKH